MYRATVYKLLALREAGAFYHMHRATGRMLRLVVTGKTSHCGISQGLSVEASCWRLWFPIEHTDNS
ncbi:hypothetical protein [Shewanella sp.]|uniref:hypothetical protein n=1 Tax=Shewanella sp. TaxID=50422 RepID=UPI003A974FE5